MDEGVDNFKAYMFITPAELSAAITAAHKRGAKVTGHLCSVGFREAAALGIDDLEHGLVVDTEFFAEKKPGECPDIPDDIQRYGKLEVRSGPVHEMILDLVQHHVAVTATLPVFEMDVPGRPTMQRRVLQALTPETRSAVLTNKLRASDQALLRKRYGTDESPWSAAFKKEMQFEHEFVKAGACFWRGTRSHWNGRGDRRIWRSARSRTAGGSRITQLEAIHIATYNGAQYLGEADKIGTISSGKQADLVVVKGDPSQKIEDIEIVEIDSKMESATTPPS